MVSTKIEACITWLLASLRRTWDRNTYPLWRQKMKGQKACQVFIGLSVALTDHCQTRGEIFCLRHERSCDVDDLKCPILIPFNQKSFPNLVFFFISRQCERGCACHKKKLCPRFLPNFKFHEKSFRISPPVSDMNATGLVHALSIMVRGDASWRPSYLLT